MNRRGNGPGILRATVRAVAAGCLLAAACGLFGLPIPVPVWQQHLSSPAVPDLRSPLAVRELADGSILFVVYDNVGVAAVRYDHGGHALSSAAFYPPSNFALAAVDPFGGIFLVEGAWTMKYDGYSGRTLWNAPVVLSLNGYPVGVFVDPAGDAIVHAFDGSQAGLLWKLDGKTGDTRWGPRSAPFPVENSTEWLVVDAAGDIFVSGLTTLGPLVYGSSTVKLDGSTGATLWGPSMLPGRIWPTSVGIDRAGDLFVVASEFFGSGPAGWSAFKYSGETGAVLWGPVFQGGPPDGIAPAGRLSVTSRGDVVVGGVFPTATSQELWTAAYSGQTGAPLWGPVVTQAGVSPISDPTLAAAGNGDVFESVLGFDAGTVQIVWRYAGSDGSAVWGPKTYPRGSTPPLACVLSDGNLLLAKDRLNAHLLTLEAGTGNPLWGPVEPSGITRGLTNLAKMATAPDGNVVAAGSVADGRLVTIKYDRASGAVIWGPVFLAVGGISAVNLAFDPAGDIVLTGLHSTTAGGGAVKYRGSDGTLLWGPSSDAPPGTVVTAIESSGDIYFLSSRLVAYDSSEFELTKISGSTGSLLWGPIHWNDEGGRTLAVPEAIGTDSNGNVFAAGGYVPVFGIPGGRPGEISYGPPRGHVYKYKGSDGSRLWHSAFARSGSPLGLARALVVGGIGNVTVTGSTPNGANEDITTIKYDGSSGAAIWGPKFAAGAANRDDVGHALVLDAVGNVYVGGEIDGGGSRSDIALVKYKWDDGALLWGPEVFAAPEEDALSTLLLDDSGNAVVNGSSFQTGRFQDIVTLAYSGATGELLWSIRTGGLGADTPSGVSAAGSSLVVAGTSDFQFLVAGYDTGFGIQSPSDLGIAYCGEFWGADLVAQNGEPEYSWSVSSGGVPPGVKLIPLGNVAGVPEQEGLYTFRAEVMDASSRIASREFTILVVYGSESIPIHVEPGLDCQTTLSVDGDFTEYEWLPGGETTPSLTVSPENPTTYGVVVSRDLGCRRRGAVTLFHRVASNPDCSSPWPRGVQPSSGAANTAVSVSIDGQNFAPGLSASLGGSGATSLDVLSPTGFTAVTPSLLPGSMNDLVVTNPGGKSGTLPGAFFADFTDVPATHSFHASVEKVFRYGVTTGCGQGVYCPDAPVTRDQMAIFILRARHGPTYSPPPATGTVFDDVPANAFGAPWIEQFYAEGISKGCGTRRFCPNDAVTRDQMAVFLLRGEHGISPLFPFVEPYVPPDPTGLFSDVPISSPYARWIEQLAREQITSGCGPATFCPAAVVTRGPMAKFLARTFHLP